MAPDGRVRTFRECQGTVPVPWAGAGRVAIERQMPRALAHDIIQGERQGRRRCNVGPGSAKSRRDCFKYAMVAQLVWPRRRSIGVRRAGLLADIGRQLGRQGGYGGGIQGIGQMYPASVDHHVVK